MRPKFLLGTTNNGKLKELRAILGERADIVGLADLGRDLPEVVEDGTSYYENALKKAIAYQRLSGMQVVADDSGLEVAALGGAPGVDSAYFGGAGLEWPQRWEYLLKQLKAFPQDRWKARFRCVICYYDGKTPPVFFEGVTSGKILPSPQGGKGFGYDPIVHSDELGMSFAQADPETKNRVSHRARALKSFADWLDQRSGRS